jgi:isoquinoline 1-oxidoreductase subunit beta
MEKNTSRRKFLVRTGIGLGVVIGASIAGCGPLRRMIAHKAEEPLPYKNKAEAYIWFELQPDGNLLLHSPKVEMGQGIHTALAQISAEELDIDQLTLRQRAVACRYQVCMSHCVNSLPLCER